MVDKKSPRLREVAKEFNVGIGTIVEFLEKKGIHIENNPNTRVDENIYSILSKEYSSDINLKKESEKIQLHKPIPTKNEEARDKDENLEDADEVRITDFTSHADIYRSDVDEFKPKIKVVGKVDLEKKKDKQESKEEPVAPEDTKSPQTSDAEVKSEKPKLQGPKIVGKVDIEKKVPSAPKNENVESIETKTKEESKIVDQKENEQIDQNFIPSRYEKLSGPTVVGKIELPDESKKKIINAQPNDDSDKKKKKKKRKRIKKFEKDALAVEKPEVISPEKVERKDRYQKFGKESETERKRPELQPKRKIPFKQEVNEEDVTKQIKETLARLTNKTKSKTTKYKKEKREALSQRQRDDEATEKNVLKVAEFVSVNDLATMMNVPVTQVITTCMNMGLFVSINQRLDAETIALVADEFGYKVEFVAVEVVEAINDSDEDKEEDLVPRPPIVTVMGHVDHGKTSLLDWIRKTNVIAGEAGGITQHIGAYSVELSNDKVITFLDTPGHEAFTAMRARGAQVTDVAIIVIAADDHIMPQTIEAINHAQAAGVPIVFAINKIDKENANPNKVKEELANMNLMVEEWGGKYQSQDISAKKGTNVDLLLEKVLLEAEILNLKANPKRKASGTVIESQLDKGRGYVATILVQNGTLKIGDIVLAGTHYGRVKAMYNERGQRIQTAGPSTPVQILGLNGAPQAGDKFNVLSSDHEAKEIAQKRETLLREQSLRAHKHITLDEIGRRIAIGNFKELNIIVKGDVDGSVEALTDSLLKLSNQEVQVNVIHKAVGQISESDVLLAAASNAIIIGFQVRPSLAARKLSDSEQIDIRLYSIIYDAINEIKDAIEGMLSPEIKEQIIGSAEVLEIFKISKVGTVAGCIVREGKIKRTNKIRVIRNGIVVYTGELTSLKRFKEDTKEVSVGLECGISIKNINDIKVGDFIEGFEEIEIKKTLD